MYAIGTAEGELAGALPEEVFCGELTDGKIVNRYGGYGGDFGEVEEVDGVDPVFVQSVEPVVADEGADGACQLARLGELKQFCLKANL